MRRYFISGDWDRRDILRPLAANLQALGHEVTSTWLWEPPMDLNDYTFRAIAEVDWADVQRADEYVLVLGKGGLGRHIEFGIALEAGIPIHLIGPRKATFHYLPDVTQYDRWDEFIAGVERAYG